MSDNSGTILNSNLISQPYDNIYNLLNNRNNVVDPIDKTGVRRMLYTREPSVESIQSADYPFVVVKRPSFEVNGDEATLDATRTEVKWDFEIEVWCSDKLKREEGNGAAFVEQIVDDILETLNNASNKKLLRCYGMGMIFPQVEDFDTLDVGPDTVFIARISVPSSFFMSIGGS